MTPKTKIQKEVARLSATLRPISDAQIEWAYKHCIEHIAYRTKNGTITCSDFGHVWHSKSTLADTLCGCRCPHCGAELKVEETRKRTRHQTRYFCVITSHKGFQVIRVAQVRYESRKGEPMKFYCTEVVQRWIAQDGKVTDMALLRGFAFCYCDVWALDSNMEVRPYNSLYDDVVLWSEVYPRMAVTAQLRRNGFKGDLHGISPVCLFKALLTDPRMETLMKAGEVDVLKYFLTNRNNCDLFWNSYKIAKRHGYHINNISMWCDYLRMLNNAGKDIRNPQTICPQDLQAVHDEMVERINAKYRKEREEAERIRKQQRMLREKENKEKFNTLKSKFFGLVITDNEIEVKVLESIEEYYDEGAKQDICVFSSAYYLKENSLVLSARIGDEIIETVEVDLKTLKVVQCHGKYNKDTEYHDRIINLVNSNAKLIRKRMTA